MRRLAFLSLLSLLSLNLLSPAFAHALLDRAEPKVGNTIETAPREVKLWFTQKLEPAFSTVTVTDGNGQRVDSGKPRINGNEMAVPLRAAGPGTYRVNWHVLSTDTHTTDGDFTFTVAH